MLLPLQRPSRGVPGRSIQAGTQDPPFVRYPPDDEPRRSEQAWSGGQRYNVNDGGMLQYHSEPDLAV